jgi:hypothetical protein
MNSSIGTVLSGQLPEGSVTKEKLSSEVIALLESSSSSGGSILTWELGETLSALTCVRTDVDSGKLIKCLNTEENIGQLLGITLQAGVEGESVSIIRQGILENTALSFGRGTRLFLSSSGTMINEIPDTGFLQTIGVMIDTQTCFVCFSQAFRR